MTGHTDASESGWYSEVDPGEVETASEAITGGGVERPADWPHLATEAGVVDSHAEYYDWLHRATLYTAKQRAHEREGADDMQLIHAVRAMDDCRRTSNELSERLAEWAGSLDGERGSGIAYARDVVHRSPEAPVDRRVVSLAERVVALDEEATGLRQFVDRTVPGVAPNLDALAGPVLAARLVAHAGGLEQLAKQPSGTVQVLGAENALFAHLQGGAPSPKHGVIYTHEYVRDTSPDRRGSAARALAGKLSIAARIDHYSGELRPELEAELDERIGQIRVGDGS